MGASSVSADIVSQCAAAGEGIGESSGPASSVIGCGGSNHTGDGPTFTVCSESNAGWTRRIRIGKAPLDRPKNPNRRSALEVSLRDYVVRKEGSVVNPVVGTSFDSLEEAYSFYNLYSWEIGFGVRYAKSRLNVHRVKCLQETVCGCAGKPLQEYLGQQGLVTRQWCGYCRGQKTVDGTYVSMDLITTILYQKPVRRSCIGSLTGTLISTRKIWLNS